MFYYLKGELVHREPSFCVIDCGGVGYKLTVSLNTSDSLLSKLGKTVTLYTHLAVREDGIELFGFGSTEERECFNNLTTVSGVGPKVAMSILSTLTPEKLALAICTDDAKAIAKAPGIGAKSALRIILELKEKMSKTMLSLESSAAPSSIADIPVATKGSALAEATEALLVLGYDKSTILAALKGINTTADVGEIIKAALKKLAGGR
ncbi:MAG: Holliday junction branch migration protein RuvA [Clostridia bacterium]|nr:Holliday junction branch migration protein RuvA [Clostridia bacterium]